MDSFALRAKIAEITAKSKQKQAEDTEQHYTPSPVSLGAYTKLRSATRNKGNKGWRPLTEDDLVEDDNAFGDPSPEPPSALSKAYQKAMESMGASSQYGFMPQKKVPDIPLFYKEEKPTLQGMLKPGEDVSMMLSRHMENVENEARIENEKKHARQASLQSVSDTGSYNMPQDQTRASQYNPVTTSPEKNNSPRPMVSSHSRAFDDFDIAEWVPRNDDPSQEPDLVEEFPINPNPNIFLVRRQPASTFSSNSGLNRHGSFTREMQRPVSHNVTRAANTASGSWDSRSGWRTTDESKPEQSKQEERLAALGVGPPSDIETKLANLGVEPPMDQETKLASLGVLPGSSTREQTATSQWTGFYQNAGQNQLYPSQGNEDPFISSSANAQNRTLLPHAVPTANMTDQGLVPANNKDQPNAGSKYNTAASNQSPDKVKLDSLLMPPPTVTSFYNHSKTLSRSTSPTKRLALLNSLKNIAESSERRASASGRSVMHDPQAPPPSDRRKPFESINGGSYRNIPDPVHRPKTPERISLSTIVEGSEPLPRSPPRGKLIDAKPVSFSTDELAKLSDVELYALWKERNNVDDVRYYDDHYPKTMTASDGRTLTSQKDVRTEYRRGEIDKWWTSDNRPDPALSNFLRRKADEEMERKKLHYDLMKTTTPLPSVESKNSGSSAHPVGTIGDNRPAGTPWNETPEHEASDTSNHLLIPLLCTLHSYLMGPNVRNGQTSGFDRFGQPPEWAIDRNSQSGLNSFFGEDFGAPPRRLGRDPRYARVAGTVGSVGAGTYGAYHMSTYDKIVTREGLFQSDRYPGQVTERRPDNEYYWR